MVSESIGRKPKDGKSSLSRQVSYLAIVIYQMANMTCLDNLLSKKNYNFPYINETCYQLFKFEIFFYFSTKNYDILSIKSNNHNFVFPFCIIYELYIQVAKLKD